VILSLLVFVNFILRTTVLNGIRVFGVAPDTGLIIVVSYAILRGEVEGAILGFFSGLLMDSFFGRYFGFFAMCGALTGYFCGKPFRDFFRENYLMPVVLAFIAAFASGIVFYIAHFLLLAKLDFPLYIYKIILPEALYTTLVSLPIYRLLYWMNRKLEKFEAKKRFL